LAHPGAIPAVAADAEELFAGRPELALLYHQRFGGVSINGNLSDSDSIRLLRAVGECCGIRLLSPQRISAKAVAEGRSARNLRTLVAPDGDAHMVSVKRMLHS
jgi:hypothetical protein